VHYRNILIITLLGIVFGQAWPQQETPSQNKHDETHSPAPVVPTHPSTRQEQGNTKDTPKKCPLPVWTDPFWPNWLLVIVTGFAVWVAFGTLSDLKEQTDTAKAAAEEAKQAAIFSRKATRESERADVLIESISTVAGDINWTQNGDGKLVVCFRNFGRTRAKDVSLRIELRIPGITLMRRNYELPTMVLGKGQAQTISTETLHDCVGMLLFKQIMKGEKQMQFTAFAYYVDVFGDHYVTWDIGEFDPRTASFVVQQKIAG
jgi:hypothetical protein